MAAMDKTQMPWGWKCGGTGTDATEVFSHKARIKALAFAGNADNATCAITTKNHSDMAVYTDTIKFKTNGNDLDAAGNYVFFGEQGIPVHGMTVTLSHADDRLYVYLA
jgi:hypothetical protein